MVLPTEVMYPALLMATTVTTATILIFFTKPAIILKFYIRLAVMLSGMKLKFVKIAGGLNICYGERGQKKKEKSSMLLLHGFSADKFMWVPLVKNLPSDLHVIVLDLPGHGDSSIPGESEDLSLMGQVERLHEIIQALGLDSDPIHLVGLSMGGALAGLYAAEYPQNVDRVSLMCPAMKTPIATPIATKIREIVESGDENVILEECPLIPKNYEEVQYLFEFAQFHKPVYMPKQVLHGVVEMRKPYNEYYFRLFKALASLENSHILEKNAHRITVPSQLVWGEEDQVIHVSGAEVLRQKLPNCQSVHIIPRCGHAINLDRPGSKTKALLDFRGELNNRRQKKH